ncbi:MAG: hypothetical protein LBC56_08065 [Oscillospiraceae bacterium]|jgi:hypothetical protein|nr:hypothetical protein [Oscillospiraceae bacterium]
MMNFNSLGSVIVTAFICLVASALLIFALATLYRKNLKKNTPAVSYDFAPDVLKSAPAAAALPPEDGYAEEIVAAITGAIMATRSASGENRPFAVKRISKDKSRHSAWRFAGLKQNLTQI